jgi:1-acyl-sn-glycerol-3-phosphate acyltransferase
MACRLKVVGLERIPKRGPGILLSNHVSNFEGPLLYVLLSPRKATALGKRELWNNVFTRFFMKTWGIIPINRNSVDSAAMKESVRMLENGYFLGVAAEGTRSRNGELKKGHAGATYLATRTNVPIYPVVHWGLPDLAGNLKKLKRTDITIMVGPPFYLRKKDGSSVTAGDRRRMTEEMMYQMSVLMPPDLRGVYADLQEMTTEYVVFPDTGPPSQQEL